MKDLADLDDLIWLRQAVKNGSARILRVRNNVSQSEQAALIGVSQTCLSRWESGDRTPRGEAALRYAKLLRHLNGRLLATGSDDAA